MQPDSDGAFGSEDYYPRGPRLSNSVFSSADYYPRGIRLSPQDQINELRSIVEERQREQRRALTIVVLCVYCFLIGRVLARADMPKDD